MNIVRLCSKVVRDQSAIKNIKISLNNNEKFLSTSVVLSNRLAPEQNTGKRWNKAVSEAEKIVGYPTSFLSLRWLLSDEIANVALHLRKLIGSNHPLLKTAKGLLYNEKNNMQAWGLIVLLVSKAAGHSDNIPEMEQDKSAGVLYTQRALAEITEMIRTSNIIHRGLVNLQKDTQFSQKSEFDDMMFGNKIALLSGDYLLCNSCSELANLKNPYLTELISAALRDQCEAEFVGPRDEQNNPLPSRPIPDKICNVTIGDSGVDPLIVADALGNAEAEWTLRHVLAGGSLLGHSCQGALKLAGHPPEYQELGYRFGKHLALAWQACLDRDPFQKNKYEGKPFSLICAPLMFQLEHDPALYAEIEKGNKSISNVDYAKLHEAVLNGPGLEKTKKLQREHSQAALEVLQNFPEGDARKALTNIILAMQES